MDLRAEAAADALGADDADARPPRVCTVPVVADAMAAVAVFRTCRLHAIAAGMGVFWDGISAQELRAGLWLHRVPAAERESVIEDVQFMAQAACRQLNRKPSAGRRSGA